MAASVCKSLSPKYKPMGLSKDKNVDILFLQIINFLAHYIQIFYQCSIKEIQQGNPMQPRITQVPSRAFRFSPVIVAATL